MYRMKHLPILSKGPMSATRTPPYTVLSFSNGGTYSGVLDEATRGLVKDLIVRHPFSRLVIGRTKTAATHLPVQAIPAKGNVLSERIALEPGLTATLFRKKHGERHRTTRGSMAEALRQFVVEGLLGDDGSRLGERLFEGHPFVTAVVIELKSPTTKSSKVFVKLGASANASAPHGPTDAPSLNAWLEQPFESAADLAARRLKTRMALRERIRTDVPLLSAAAVASAAGYSATNPRTYSRRLREKGALAVREGNTFVFPAFQFTTDGRLREEMADVLEAVNAEREPSEVEEGWAALVWFFSPTGLLAGRRPMDVFAEDPMKVIKAARRQFPSLRKEAQAHGG